MARTLGLIGAPSSAGAYAPGQEKAPGAFRRHGLMAALSRTGRELHDRGDVPGFRWRPDLSRPKAMNLDVVQRTAQHVADRVAEALASDENVLVLGGDCTIELGTVAGALPGSSSVGLVYIDLDTDLNPPEESDGALDWTGVAHLLDVPGAAPELAALGSRRPLLGATDVLFLAPDNITPGEARTIEAQGLAVIRLADVAADPVGAAARAATWGARFERLLVHLDIDVLSYVDFPIAENVRREPGLSLSALSVALATLTAAPNWRGLTLTEVNPDHAPDEGETFASLIGMLTKALPA